jgi:hypothetical protein
MPRLAVSVILFAALLASGQEAASSKRIVSRKYGFSFERPAGWIAAVGVDSDLPLLANFPLVAPPNTGHLAKRWCYDPHLGRG